MLDLFWSILYFSFHKTNDLCLMYLSATYQEYLFSEVLILSVVTGVWPSSQNWPSPGFAIIKDNNWLLLEQSLRKTDTYRMIPDHGVCFWFHIFMYYFRGLADVWIAWVNWSNILYINTLYFVEKIDLHLPNLKAEPGISILEGRKMRYVWCVLLW